MNILVYTAYTVEQKNIFKLINLLDPAGKLEMCGDLDTRIIHEKK